MRLTWNTECSIFFHLFKIIFVFSPNKYELYIGFVYMISQVISLAYMCFFIFWDSPIFKEDMNIYVMQSQSFCEDIYVTAKGVWSWDWRDKIVVRINLSLDTNWTEYTWWSLQSLASTEISVSDAHSVYMVLLSWQIIYPSVQYLGHLFVLKSMPLGRLWAIE